MNPADRTRARIEEAAADLEVAQQEVLDFLHSLRGAEWRATGTREGRPVAAVAYHVADGYRIHLRWLDLLRLGRPVPGTPADLDVENARTLADAAELPTDVVVSAVETAGRLLVAYVRDLEDGELSVSAPHGPLGHDEMSVDFMLDITAWHVREHLGSMRAAVEIAS